MHSADIKKDFEKHLSFGVMKLFTEMLILLHNFQHTHSPVFDLGKHVPEMTNATIMGTTCWPFNSIHVRGDGGKVSFLRQSTPSDCKKKETMTSQTLPLRTHHFIVIHAHRQHKHPEHMVQNTARRIKWTSRGCC